MAPNRGHNRAKVFRDALDRPALGWASVSLSPRNPLTLCADFDPEGDESRDDPHQDASDDDSDDAEAHADDAREHYVDVDQSKLRRPKSAALGPQYRGSRIDRKEMLEEEEEDDPFTRGFDGEDDGDSESASTQDGSEHGGDTEDNDASNTSLSDSEVTPPQHPTAVDRAALLKELAKDQRSVAASLAQATKADVEKGVAVKKQKTTFDTLLNSRIKLQKSLVASNTLIAIPTDDLTMQLRQANDSLDAAENAAVAFWASVNSFREDLIARRTGEKRKRGSLDARSSIDQLVNKMQAQEDSWAPHRNATLQRWSRKAQAATALPERGIINKSANQPTIIDALQEHLSNRDRLFKRAHTARSCSPFQVANRIQEDERIYDDADFYGLLLKELLEQRGADSVAAANVDLTSGMDLRRAAKAKKHVDTKASKGRKLRYTVHEKLQNFMAPEDRSTWGERQADDLFRGLFGQRMGLGETAEQDGLAEDGYDGGDDGLRLFRT